MSSGPTKSALPPGSLASLVAFKWRHRVLISLITGLCTLAAILYVMLVPVKYTSTATLLPQAGTGPGLLSVAASLAGSSLPFAGLGALNPESAIQEAIIRSERLADLIDNEFDLTTRYKAENRETRLRVWQASLGTQANQQGLLMVSFQDEDPEFAFAVLSRLLEHLDEFNRVTRSTASRRTRQFVEKRLVEARSRLAETEDALVAYQAENQSLALSPTSEAVVAAGAEILAQRVRLQIDLQMLRESLSANAPAVRNKEAEIAALDQELSKLPELGSDLAVLLRDQRVRERTYGFLAAQLEDARIEEARDTPTVDLLDAPKVPQEKSWPKRKLTVLLVAFLSGLLSLLLAKILDTVKEVRQAEAAS
ncbi:MAG: hypothetical protein HKN21_08995 [Candidatus Eisenbacteria bacterium]|uniref:Polysaccharide chain length determinant N-terminal domain-containing protein n=1 Tax=Eiseniibacteriota bacterium TaxID=2212470 RepID=A0A7Y2EBG9_UNCEI|nr:hypothetical protein [Candidatus Eisenbacteria bacterium]